MWNKVMTFRKSIQPMTICIIPENARFFFSHQKVSVFTDQVYFRTKWLSSSPNAVSLLNVQTMWTSVKYLQTTIYTLPDKYSVYSQQQKCGLYTPGLCIRNSGVKACHLDHPVNNKQLLHVEPQRVHLFSTVQWWGSVWNDGLLCLDILELTSSASFAQSPVQKSTFIRHRLVCWVDVWRCFGSC